MNRISQIIGSGFPKLELFMALAESGNRPSIMKVKHFTSGCICIPRRNYLDHLSVDAHRRKSRGALGALAPQDFAISKEVPFFFSENAPFFLRKIVPSKCRAPKFDMLPTSLPIPRLVHKEQCL